MDLMKRLGRSSAALALMFAGTGAASAQEVDDLANQIAAQSAAFTQVLDRLKDPRTAKLAVDSAIAGDARTFNQIFAGIELPVVDKCFWIRELVEKFASSTRFVEQCWVREDLSAQEWLEYTKIAIRHDLIGRDSDDDTVYEKDAHGHVLIPRGAFLDELKANNLVTCTHVRKTTGYSKVVFGKPERVCIQTP